jgi:transcription antitermination factor NusG
MKEAEIKNWMVLYTRSRWEKKVDRLLKNQKINSFCPLVKTTRQWVDRNKIIEIPLFQSYLFVHINAYERAMVMQTSGVINFISYCGKPATMKDNEIERIRTIVNEYTDIKTISLKNINIGDTVKVTNGPLLNHEGEVSKIQGRSVVMILDNINCALTVKINQKQLSFTSQQLLSSSIN